MAQSDAQTAAPDAEDENAKVKKGLAAKIKARLRGRTLLILVGLALTLCGGVATYFFLFKTANTHTAQNESTAPLTPPKAVFSDMQDILVNIQSSDATPAYLKLGISLELDDEAQKAAITALMPRITDQFQAYLRELRLDDLKGAAGVLRLKEELLRRVNVVAAPYHVRDVLLKEMIVQ